MSHSTTETFKMKREILNYSGRISDPLRKPERKFFADMLFGILASGSCSLNGSFSQICFLAYLHREAAF